MSNVIGMLDKILSTPPEITLGSPEEGLEEVKMLTESIRQHQDAILNLGKRRKKVVVALRYQYGEASEGTRVTYKAIAEAMGTTDQSVYKILFPPTTGKKKASKSTN